MAMWPSMISGSNLEILPHHCLTIHFSVSLLILRMPAQRYQKRLCPVQPLSQHHLRILIHSFVTVTSMTTCVVGSLTMTVGRSGGIDSQLRAVKILGIIAQIMNMMDPFCMSALKKAVMLEIVQLYPPRWVRKPKVASISTSTYTMGVASGH